MMIVGVSGYGYSGKDTVGVFLRAHGFKRYAFADKVREAALAVNPVIGVDRGHPVYLSEIVKAAGWDKAKQGDEVRRILQRVGTEMGRKVFYEDFWTDALFRQLHFDQPEKVVITDVRFPNEANRIIQSGGVVVRIERQYHGPIQGPDGEVHPSETALDGYTDFWKIISNHGTLEDLRDKVDMIVEDLEARSN